MTITKKEAKKLGLIKQLNSSEEVSLIISVPDFQIGSSASSKGTLILKGVGITQEPKTGYGKLYAKSADGKLYYKNPIHNSGEEVDITGGSITVTEEDGNPSVSDVTTLKFTNSTVTDNGDGSVSVTTSTGTIAADNISAGDAAVSISTTSGNITLDSNAGSVTVDGHTGVTLQSTNSGDITLDSVADILLDAATTIKIDSDTGDISFEDGGVAQLAIDMDGTAGEIIIGVKVASDDLVFQNQAGQEQIRLSNTRGKVFFYDEGGEYIQSDGTNMTITGGTITLTGGSTSAITIDASGHVTKIGQDSPANGQVLAWDGTNSRAVWNEATSASSLACDDLTVGDSAVTVSTTLGNILVDSIAGSTTIDGHTGITVTSSNSGEIDITSAANVDINATTGVTIDGTTISIDGTDDVNLTITSSTAGEDLTISQAGANDSSILITAAGTGIDAISIDATAGDMVIGSSLIDGKTLTLGNTNSTYLKLIPHGTAASEKILLYNAVGTADDAIKIHSDAGGVTIKADNDSLHIDADGTDSDALNIDSAGGIDIDAAGVISLDSSAGSIDINVVDGQTVKIGLNGAVEQIIAPHGTVGSELYSVINTAGTTDGSGAAGAILLSAVAGGIGLAWADSKDLWAEGGQFIVTANHDTSEAIKLHADAGSSQTIQIINDEGTTDGSEGAGAIDIEATVGGISLHAADDKDIAIEAGQVVVTANHNTAGAIKLHADAGTSQTILIQNDAGTGTGAVNIAADAGGVTIDAGLEITLDADGADIFFKDSGTEVGSLQLTGTTNMTLRSKGDLSLDSNTGKWLFEDEGTHVFQVTGSSGNVTVEIPTSDKDLIFKVNDGGTATEVMTIDGSTSWVGIHTSDPEAYLDIKNTVDDGTTNRTMLRLHNYRSDDADVNDFGPISIDFDVENAGGGAKTGTARITAVSSPVGTDHTTVLGEKTSGLLFSTMNDDTLSEAMRINAVGAVGIGFTDPKTALDVHYTGSIDPTGLSNDTGGGEVVYFGTNATVTAGKLYYLDTNGAWDEASAASGSFPHNSLSGSSQLLAIALGTNTNENGMLIKGFFDATTYLNNFSSGQAIAIHTASGKMDTTFPSGSGDFIRIAGYCTNTANVIYFNPAGSWVEIA
jgi:hypothetical protein